MKIWKKILAACLIVGLTGNMTGTAMAAYQYADPFELPQLTGNQREDIIAVAQSQIGYTEAEDGSTVFGAWAGNPTQNWCSEFAAWCAYKAGIPESIFPHKRSSNAYEKFYAPKGRFFFLEGGIGPEGSLYQSSRAKTISVSELEKGDILFFEVNDDPSDGADHTGLFIEEVDGKILYISGNTNDSVMESYSRTGRIHGVCKPAYKDKSSNAPVASSSNGDRGSGLGGSLNIGGGDVGGSGGTSGTGGSSGSGGSSSSSHSVGPGSSGGNVSSANTLNTTGQYLYDGTWNLDNKGWKLRNTDGSLAQSQWAYLNGQWYVFGFDGYMLTGWQNIDGHWYYLYDNGAMAVGWVLTNNKWYCLAPNGMMYSSVTTPDGYPVDASGAWIVSG